MLPVLLLLPVSLDLSVLPVVVSVSTVNLQQRRLEVFVLMMIALASDADVLMLLPLVNPQLVVEAAAALLSVHLSPVVMLMLIPSVFVAEVCIMPVTVLLYLQLEICSIRGC